MLDAGEGELEVLLGALPALRALQLQNVPMRRAEAERLHAAAVARGMTLLLPTSGFLDGSESDSSTSDCSDDGCPRYSWGGNAYAARCGRICVRMRAPVHVCMLAGACLAASCCVSRATPAAWACCDSVLPWPPAHVGGIDGGSGGSAWIPLRC